MIDQSSSDYSLLRREAIWGMRKTGEGEYRLEAYHYDRMSNGKTLVSTISMTRSQINILDELINQVLHHNDIHRTLYEESRESY